MHTYSCLAQGACPEARGLWAVHARHSAGEESHSVVAGRLHGSRGCPGSPQAGAASVLRCYSGCTSPPTVAIAVAKDGSQGRLGGGQFLLSLKPATKEEEVEETIIGRIEP